MSEAYHIPVMLREAVEGLRIGPDGTYVDVTFGGGGHSIEILNRLGSGKLFGFDQDPDAARNAPDDPRFTLIPHNFRYVKNYLRLQGVRKIDGLLADLGISSHHIDAPERGFSIRHNAPLDMRMDQKKSQNAHAVVNTYSEERLVEVLREYGELKNARRIAQLIANARTEQPIETTFDLLKAIGPATPRQKEFRFQALVFQAIRMEVNQELHVLEELLTQSVNLIRPGGRIAIITYHSLEDRLVKHFLRTGNAQGKLEKDFFGNLIRPFEPLQSKPTVPTDSEIQQNNRARSAKLRVATRIATDAKET